MFSGWSDSSTTATLSFPATSDMVLTAFFNSAPNCATFDFDNGNVGSSLPLDLLSTNGLSAHFEGGYSIQPVGTLGIAPAGMSGLYLYPSSVFPSDLLIRFPVTLTDFSIHDYALIFFADNVTVTFIPPVSVQEPLGPRGVARLFDPAPNPFHPATTIAFELPAAGDVRLRVYDLSGRFVRSLIERSMPEGIHRVTWDGTDGAGNPAHAGLYLLRLEAAGTRANRRMMPVR